MLGRSLGGGMREFKDGVTGRHARLEAAAAADEAAEAAQPVKTTVDAA